MMPFKLTPIREKILKNRSEKFIRTLAAANILLASECLSALTLNAPEENTPDTIELVQKVGRADIKNEHNAGCGNAGCGANASC